jgi:hypothetical protein
MKLTAEPAKGDDADDFPLKWVLYLSKTQNTPRACACCANQPPQLDVIPLMRWVTPPRTQRRVQGGESIQAKR